MTREATCAGPPEDAILLPEIVDEIFVAASHPASQSQHEEVQSVGHGLKLRGSDTTVTHVVSGIHSPRPFFSRSRYILVWTLRTSMQASDVTETLDLAQAQAGVDRVRVVHRPRLFSDNGPGSISQELADYLDTHGLAHPRGAPYHPMTQGKIERDHRSMKNVVKLEQYFSPWALQRTLARVVEDYNHRRYHESLQNVTPADVYHGRRPQILARRAQMKQRTLRARRRENLRTPHHAVQWREVSLATQPQWSGLV